MKRLYLVVFMDEVLKIFKTYDRALVYIEHSGNPHFKIEEVNYE